MAKALRSLAGKLRPLVAATLRRAPASRSLHPEEKLSSMTSSKTKTPVDDNCFELLGDKYFEERSRIFAQLVKEDARRTEEQIAAYKKLKRAMVASSLGAAIGIFALLIRYNE
uniref:Uncharacterized protein n=1 Tax=Oryza meridionalis TaxID=40149 RepID=A0A0E0DAP7_9ORYZ